MLALSIRQPYAELILRGIKTIEYRSRATRIVGERFWIYASKKGAGRQTPVIRSKTQPVTSDNLSAVDAPPWMIELANGLRLFPNALPMGVIVGSAVIDKVKKVESRELRVDSLRTKDRSLLSTANSPLSTYYEWHLTHVERAKRCRKPTGHPQPVWFHPF